MVAQLPKTIRDGVFGRGTAPSGMFGQYPACVGWWRKAKPIPSALLVSGRHVMDADY